MLENEARDRQHGEASGALVAAVEILAQRSKDRITGAPPAFAPALWALYAAVTGKSEEKLTPTRRVQSFDAAASMLSVARSEFLKSAGDAAQSEWLSRYFDEPMRELRSGLLFKRERPVERTRFSCRGWPRVA